MIVKVEGNCFKCHKYGEHTSYTFEHHRGNVLLCDNCSEKWCNMANKAKVTFDVQWLHGESLVNFPSTYIAKYWNTWHTELEDLFDDFLGIIRPIKVQFT
jgi:hypothetical protein